MPFPIAALAGIFDVGLKLIDKFIPDPEAKAKAQLELLAMQQNGELEQMKTQLSAIIAEAQSSDPYTSRARPSFLYVMYIYMLAAIPFGVTWVFYPAHAALAADGFARWLNAIPEPMYALFGAGFLGYTAFRSWDKRGAGK